MDYSTSPPYHSELSVFVLFTLIKEKEGMKKKVAVVGGVVLAIWGIIGFGASAPPKTTHYYCINKDDGETHVLVQNDGEECSLCKSRKGDH